MQAGKIALLAPGQCIGKQEPGINLSITGQVKRNTPGAQVITLVADAVVQAVGRKELLPWRQCATGCSQGFS